MKILVGRRLRWIATGIAGLSALAGCQSIPEGLGGDAGPLFRRGIVSQSVQGLSFSPCFVSNTEQIIDRTGRLLNRLERTNEPAVYAELSGDHFTPGDTWQVYKVHLMGGQQSTCNYELSGNEYRAAGDHPLWIADLRDDGIYVHNYDRMAQLVFPRNEPINLGNGWEWNSNLAGFGSHRLSLRIQELTCRDRHGVDYEFKAEMVLDGKTFVGCARKGELDIRTLPGLYTAEIEGLRGAGRFITLDLAGDGSIVLTQDYRNRQPLIVQKGSWQWLDKGKLVVHLTELDGRDDNEVLVFQRDRYGALMLKGFSATYGKGGLRLERAGPERIFRKFNRQ